MKWKGFTSEEIVLLRNNPYTLKVTERTSVFCASGGSAENGDVLPKPAAVEA